MYVVKGLSWPTFGGRSPFLFLLLFLFIGYCYHEHKSLILSSTAVVGGRQWRRTAEQRVLVPRAKRVQREPPREGGQGGRWPHEDYTLAGAGRAARSAGTAGACQTPAPAPQCGRYNSRAARAAQCKHYDRPEAGECAQPAAAA